MATWFLTHDTAGKRTVFSINGAGSIRHSYGKKGILSPTSHNTKNKLQVNLELNINCKTNRRKQNIFVTLGRQSVLKQDTKSTNYKGKDDKLFSIKMKNFSLSQVTIRKAEGKLQSWKRYLQYKGLVSKIYIKNSYRSIEIRWATQEKIGERTDQALQAWSFPNGLRTHGSMHNIIGCQGNAKPTRR